MHRAAAYLRLVRPANLLITAAGVYLGGALAVSELFPDEALVARLATACASAVLIAAGGNAVNDVFDYDVDVINRPDRPLPSGEVSPVAARGIWIAASLAGIILGAVISFVHFALAVFATVLLVAYSAHLKRIPFVGNLAIAFLVGLAVVYGGDSVGSPVSAFVAAGFAMLSTFARELVKAIEDIEGDRAAGLRTAPIAYGIPSVRSVAASVLILTVLLTPVPFLSMDYSQLFLLLVLVADLMLLRVIWLLPHAPHEARDASSWLKGAMVAGVAALFAA